jgi:glycolate oxidase FAD binding subunit
MLDLVSFEDRLRRDVPPAALLSSPSEYVVDGREPSVVVAPSSQDEVAAVLTAAAESGATVIAWGGGNHMALGGPLARYDLALDLQRLNRVVEYEPADLTVTVEAGIRLAELNRHLAAHGQWLPLDPPAGPTATIGGILASNASGPAKIAHGTARDLVIGMTFATAKGELVKSGGRVVKNVAGYDLAKLQIGALGTLGVISQVSFKVAPLPRQTETVVYTSGSLEAIAEASWGIWDAGLACNGLVTGKWGNDWLLAVRLAGGSAAVERSQREVSRIAAGLSTSSDVTWDDLLSISRPRSPGSLIVRAAVKPTDITRIASDLAAAGAEVVAYPGVGVCHGRWPDAGALDDAAFVRLRTECESAGGALVIEAAPVEVKRRLGVWGDTRGDFTLMRRLKETFNPNGSLSPGRFVGGL